MIGIILSDLHCGSHFGLTPPEYHYQSTNPRTRVGRLGKLQRQNWELFDNDLRKRYHFALWAGDLIDGPAKKQSGSENITTDIEEQVKIAAEVVEHVGAKYNYLARGTAYHTGNDFDGENWITDKLAAKGKHIEIKDQIFPEFGGHIFDLKHHTGKTCIPHGTTTGPKKAHVHNMLWAAKGMAPQANITIRGHIHEYTMIKTSDWTGITCPALSCLGIRYARRLDSQVDFGFLEVEIKKGEISWHEKIRPLLHQSQKTSVIPSS